MSPGDEDGSVCWWCLVWCAIIVHLCLCLCAYCTYSVLLGALTTYVLSRLSVCSFVSPNCCRHVCVNVRYKNTELQILLCNYVSLKISRHCLLVPVKEKVTKTQEQSITNMYFASECHLKKQYCVCLISVAQISIREKKKKKQLANPKEIKKKEKNVQGDNAQGYWPGNV